VHPPRSQQGQLLALAFGTFALIISFMVWSLISPLAPEFQGAYHLTNTQVSLIIAAPVLFGALGRIAMGSWADRHGGRLIFALGLAAMALPLVLVALSRSYGSLLGGAVVLGIAGTTFAAGVPFVSRWFPIEKQGLALGVYGMGNIGTAFSALLVPRIARGAGWPTVFWTFVPVVLLTAGAFYTVVRNSPAPPRAAKAPSPMAALGKPLAWLFSFWYFITFGGFVAFGGYLPKLYTDLYGLSKTQAGPAASVFVFTATLVRPLGGWISDRIGGKRAVSISLAGIAIMAAVLTLALPLGPFRLTILAMGLFMGLGNGAVFKLVPEFFPAFTGAVTGLVGALGALGGFFPPLVMGLLRDRLGTYTPAFALLAATAAVGWLLVGSLTEQQAPWQRSREQASLHRLEQLFASRAAMNAFIVTAVLMVLVYLGSGNLRHFDPALYGYAVATAVAIIGLTIRLTAWLMRPPTRTIARRTLQMLFLKVNRMPGVANPIPGGVGRWYEGRRHPAGNIEAADRLMRAGAKLPPTKGGDPGLKPEAREESAIPGGPTPAGAPGHPARPGAGVAVSGLVTGILLNRFIFRRGLWRGLQHFLLMWGIFGSFAITIPLTFGWLHFEAVGQTHYRVIAFGLPLFTMPVHGVLAGLIYHGLSSFAVITLGGLAMMLIRRLLDKDAKVDQRIEYDLVPLYVLLAVTVTGLALTVSHVFLEGWSYPVISIIHQITVVAMLLYLPFGKLFHIPMRGLGIGADVYHEVGAHQGLLACARCRKVYATKTQIQDVVAALKEAGQTLLAPDGKTYLAEYCPECRRVIRGLIYARRDLRPDERGSAHPVIAGSPMTEGGAHLDL
jgi:NNP family nitrate/nitrite transporter-like MFS transporter